MNDVSGFAAALAERAGSVCELCGSHESLSVMEVPPSDTPDADRCILICETCGGPNRSTGLRRRQSLAMPERFHVERHTCCQSPHMAFAETL
jgi:hypothetical protein